MLADLHLNYIYSLFADFLSVISKHKLFWSVCNIVFPLVVYSVKLFLIILWPFKRAPIRKLTLVNLYQDRRSSRWGLDLHVQNFIWCSKQMFQTSRVQRIQDLLVIVSKTGRVSKPESSKCESLIMCQQLFSIIPLRFKEVTLRNRGSGIKKLSA